ncbi:MAG: hypothetical protein QXT25_01015 [Candidatus Anstonellaceae archaeon]
MNQYKLIQSKNETIKDILEGIKDKKTKDDVKNVINNIKDDYKYLKDFLVGVYHLQNFNSIILSLIKLYDKDPNNFRQNIEYLHSVLLQKDINKFSEELSSLTTSTTQILTTSSTQIPLPKSASNWYLIGMSLFSDKPFSPRYSPMPHKPSRIWTPFDQRMQQIMYGDLNQSFIQEYNVQAWPFQLDFPERYLNLFRPTRVRYPFLVTGYFTGGSLVNLNFNSGNIDTFSLIDTAHLVTGVNVLKNKLIINQAAIAFKMLQGTTSLSRIERHTDLSSKLDLLFRNGEKTTGQMLVFLENKRYGILQGYYYDGKSWFASDLVMRDGKIISGGTAQGVLQGDSLAGLFNYNKLGENDTFYVVLYSNSLGAGVEAQQNTNQKLISFLKNLDDFSVEVGVFSLERGYFGQDVDKAQGGIIGFGNQNFHVSTFVGSEHSEVNILGLAAAAQRTAASFFIRKNEEGDITHGNINLSTSKKIGNTTITFSSRVKGSKRSTEGQGAIEVRIGEDADATIIRFGYDGISQVDFFKRSANFFNSQNITDTRSLINAINALLLVTPLENFPYPLAQVEIEKDGGRITLSKLKEGGSGFSYEIKDFMGMKKAFSSLALTPKGKILNLGFDVDHNNQLVLQVGNKNVALGTRVKIGEGKIVGSAGWEQGSFKTTFGYSEKLGDTSVESAMVTGKSPQGNYWGGQLNISYKIDDNVNLGGSVGVLKFNNITYFSAGSNFKIKNDWGEFQAGFVFMFSKISPLNYFFSINYGSRK